MTRWPDRTIGEIVDGNAGLVQTGPFGSQLHRSDYTDGDGVPLVMPKNMVAGRIDYSSIAKVNPEKAATMRRHACAPLDVLVSRRGEIGRCALVRPNEAGVLCGTGSIRISVHGSDLIPEFLFYFLSSDRGRDELEARAVGATMANLSAGAVRLVRIPTPPLDTQRKIASVLSAYDDLIENNRRRIAILEEMVQRLYHEWFVAFRYPGHDAVAVAQSKFGPLPDGWDRVQASDLIAAGSLAIGDGYRAKNSELGKNGLPFVRIGDLRDDFAFDDVDRLRPESMSAVGPKASRPGDCIVCTKGTVGRVAFVPREAERFVYSPQLSYWRTVGDVLTREYLVSWMRGPDFERQCAYVKGATDMADYVNLRDQRRMHVSIPPMSVQKRFAAQVGPALDAIGTLWRSTRVASATRDLLLPRLVSGGIDVGDLDISIEEPAA